MAHLNTYSGQSDASTTASTASFTVPASATYAAVFVGMRGGDGPATTLSAATMGGVNFELLDADTNPIRVFHSYQAEQAGYMLAADLPSGEVTATATRGTATNGMTISVLFFDDAAQQVPVIGLGGNASGGDPINTAITMPSSGIIADGITTSNGSSVFTTNQANQTERANENVPGASVNSWVSTREVTAGSRTMGWGTNSNTQRTSHIVLGIEAGAGSASITPATATPIDGSVQTITCSGMTGPLTAASEGGLDVFSGLSGTDPSVPITFTVDVSATEASTGMPRIGELSTIVFETAVDGPVTVNVTLQPKANWIIQTLAATLLKETSPEGQKDFLKSADDGMGLVTVVGNLVYMSVERGEAITPQGHYTGGTTVAYQSTEFVLQQGGSATTTATSEGGQFYPFGEPAQSGQTENPTGSQNALLAGIVEALGGTVTGTRRNDLLQDILDALGGVSEPDTRNDILIDIVVASGGVVGDVDRNGLIVAVILANSGTVSGTSRNALLQNWLDSI